MRWRRAEGPPRTGRSVSCWRCCCCLGLCRRRRPRRDRRYRPTAMRTCSAPMRVTPPMPPGRPLQTASITGTTGSRRSLRRRIPRWPFCPCSSPRLRWTGQRTASALRCCKSSASRSGALRASARRTRRTAPTPGGRRPWATARWSSLRSRAMPWMPPRRRRAGRRISL